MESKPKHFLQSPEWSKVNQQNGWKSLALESGASSFTKSSPGGKVIYIPGYLPASETQLQELSSRLLALKGSNLVAKLETCSPVDLQLCKQLEKLGWQKGRTSQYSHTVLLDLTQTADELLKNMKSRARYEVNSAKRQGVKIQEVLPTDQNLDTMLALLQETSRRKKFTMRDKKFLLSMWRTFREAKNLKLFFARHENDIVASAIIIANGKDSAWYKYGASNLAKSKLFGARLLIFEAAKLLKDEGYRTLDLGGIPDPRTYETSHMRGVFVFKTAYSNEITELMPAYELPLNKRLYKLWPKLELAYLKKAKLRSKMFY